MTKKLIIFIILISLLIAGGIFWWWQSGKKEGEIPTGLPEGIEYATPETGVIEGVVKPAPFSLEDVVVDPETGLKIVKDEIVIIFKEGVSEEERNEIIASIDGVVVGYGLSGQEVDVKIKNSPSIEDLKRIVKGLKQNPKVEIADLSPVGTIYPQRIPNLGKDPQWKDSWNEKNPSGKNWGLEAISTPSAWDHNDLIQKVKIGIVDIGFKINHEDLKIPEGISQISYLNLKKLIRDIDEINSREKRKECKLSQEGAINHGTHIAGIVGALSNNEVGITGILWERDLSIYEIDLKQYNLLKGVEWLLNRGVKIINLSFGFNSKCTPEEKIEDGQEYYNVKLKELRKRFPDLLIIQAAGNSDTEATKEILFNPELKKPKYEELEKVVITVGAIELNPGKMKSFFTGDWDKTFLAKGNGQYLLADFSNYGRLIDVVAPGVDIYSTLRDESILNNLLCFDFFNRHYGCMQGTSMAAPFVTGVAGLVWGANPDLTAEQVKEIIINSADRPITYKDKEYKILNAKTSVELVLSEGRKIAEEGEEKKEERTEEKPDLLKETGPAALVPKPPEEEKPKEEQKETPEIITSIPSGKIAFVSDRDGNKEIYMLKANSTKAINLTNNSADDWDPVWSPDGSELAFVSDRDGANKIYIMDSNGSNVRGLTEGEDPYWFPDGSRIIFTYLLEGEKFMCGSSIYPRYGLFIINTNGKQKKEQLSLAPSTFEKDDMLKKYNLKDPIISPDGEKIAFSAGNWNCGWQHSIYVINLKGEFLNKYSTIPWKYPGDLFNPSWSPDGVKLIFNSYNGYHGGYCSRGAFFNDEIEFKWGKCNSELTGKWELDQRYDIWEVSEISQDRNKLLKGDYPVWSPSGKKIAFTGKGFNVFFMDNDGHNTKQVTNLGRNWDSDWSQ